MKKYEDQATTTTVVVEDPSAKGLTAEEERVLRMRSGATLTGDAPLGSKLSGVAAAHRDEVAIRLMLIEREALAALAEDLPPANPQRKRRIVEALREKSED
ncbi:MAG: hypothetical protein KC620_12940 [Myxococcales bacterium]|nr:hypothetical protein [Myxococcales bacterium]